MKSFLHLSILLTGVLMLDAGNTPPPSTVIPIDSTAWAGSSVNMIANNRQPVISDGISQYAAYYDADGTLAIAKRRLGEETWIVCRTPYQGNVADAHCFVSIALDGAGFLHVAWDHHNNALNYARSAIAGGIEMGPRLSMLGREESRVTYPQFFLLPEGDLLFLYRDGGSGNGSLVINRYETAAKTWHRVQDMLIDGEGERSAYWDLCMDPSGTLHLAWIWRETPDVASNHDLLYARSDDGGITWTRSDHSPYSLPITATNAEVAVAIEQHSNLMNPPGISTDSRGVPFLVSYWSVGKDEAPRFNVVVREESNWRVIPGPQSKTPFSLSGYGTKAPPWSRAALLIESNLEHRWVHLVYRDEAYGNRAVISMLAEPLLQSHWETTPLTADSLGFWEPSYDPARWQSRSIANILVQRVRQNDGNDREAAVVEATSLGLLEFDPASLRR